MGEGTLNRRVTTFDLDFQSLTVAGGEGQELHPAKLPLREGSPAQV